MILRDESGSGRSKRREGRKEGRGELRAWKGGPKKIVASSFGGSIYSESTYLYSRKGTLRDGRRRDLKLRWTDGDLRRDGSWGVTRGR